MHPFTTRADSDETHYDNKLAALRAYQLDDGTSAALQIQHRHDAQSQILLAVFLVECKRPHLYLVVTNVKLFVN